jgi:hypothetical protein
MGKGHKKSPQGKIYSVKTPIQCKNEGIIHMSLPHLVAIHKVICLSQNANAEGKVAIATVLALPFRLLRKLSHKYLQITSTVRPGVNYYPIAPSPRESYSFQLHIRDYNNQYRGPPAAIPFLSYLRLQKHYVPLEMLVEVKGDCGEPLMLKKESVTKLKNNF